jgi:capsular polysaccharide biosynthesis protein
LELADILRSLRRRWKISVAVLLLTGVVIAVFSFTREDVEPPPRFAASVDVLLPGRDEKGNLPSGIPARLFFGQATLAAQARTEALNSADVPVDQRAAVAFDYSTNETGELVTLRATAPDAALASSVSQSWAEAYIGARAKAVSEGSAASRQGSRRALQVLTTRLRAIETEIQAINPALLDIEVTPVEDEGNPAASGVPPNLGVDAALLVYERSEVQARIADAGRAAAEQAADALLPGNFAQVVQVPPAINVTAPATPSKTPTLLIVAIGLLLALALPVLIDRMDHTIRDAKAATVALSAPVLSSIPASTRARREEIARPGTPREAAFRALAATAVATDRLPRSIVVTSPLGDMQDTVAANFAAALAGMGVRVALIGTLPRQAWFTEASIRPNGAGTNPGPDENGDGAEDGNGDGGVKTFPQLLELAYAGRLNGDAPSHLLRTRIENLFVVPPGDTEIDIANDGLPPMLEALAAYVDVTVIAAPALLEDANTTIYAWTTRSVLWVMESGEITAEQARNAASRLALAGATPLGVAMIDPEN